MDGVHDLGGMHGFGRVEREPNEPVFHEAWEAAVYAVMRASLGTGLYNLDEFRHGVERSSEPTRLVLRAQRVADRMRVEVEQSRGGVDGTAATGVGLGTLRERLAALHGARAQVGLEALPGGGARAWFELPAVS